MRTLLNENHCFSFMFYGIRRVLCIVYYTKTFSFVILWCQSNNSNSNMQSWEFLPSFISFLFALFLCSIMLQGNMAANVCVNTHQCSTPCSILLSHSNVWFAISRSRKTTWFIVFDWCMIGVSCLWVLTNDKSFPTWLRWEFKGIIFIWLFLIF